MAKVSLKNVSRSYPGADGNAVSAVTLEIGSSEFVVLTGPSGSGKTTLLRMIAGLEEVSNGEIMVDERRVNELKPNERDIAMVFPEAALYPAMSVRENIAFGLKLRKFSTSEMGRRVEDSAANLVIHDLLDRRPEELSPVQRQRVSLARAVARQPKVILLDEPLSNLDASSRAEMRADIKKLFDRLQATVIYATGDATEAMAMGNRVVVMSEGSVQQDAAPAGAIYDTPANMFVAGFFGAPPMNLIQGTLKLESDFLLFSEAGEGTIRARLPLAEHAAARDFVGKAVMLGVRPEDVEIVTVAKGQESATLSFPAIAELAEENGPETYLHLQTGAHAITSRALRRSLRDQTVGRRVRFRFDPEKAHLFDPHSTLRIAEL